jgi:hypothetical protein
MRKALATSLESTYLSSPVYNSALELYRLSLEGKLKSGDEPAALIKAVMRGTQPVDCQLPSADC